MGSTGSGRFSDYSGEPKTESSGGSSGGSSGSDKCGEGFTVSLEDVASHEFYETHGSGPVVGTELTIEIRRRVVAVADGLPVGSLPTSFNYLARCLKDGFSYTGVVSVSLNGDNPQIRADFVVS